MSEIYGSIWFYVALFVLSVGGYLIGAGIADIVLSLWRRKDAR